ncbi:MAG: arginine--tRNA ligase [Flammeovirgaceae bacterium]|nr:arginine--tRNA ligase [Flammeovirgaceae bacterium]|tara:strand:- start:251 stop:2041 length:1791 start_codon:yes stop_codon:yes gene_type:complete
MQLQEKIKNEVIKVFKDEFNYKCSINDISIDQTPKNFSGFYTLILFPHLKSLKINLEEAGNIIGDSLIRNSEIISDYNLVKGFLNFDLKSDYLIGELSKFSSEYKSDFKKNKREIIVEFSSPNTNKPLHLGHLRNIFLGDSVSKIYKSLGYKVHKVQIINDRGIHICKSMVAWKRYGNDKSPDTEKVKGDKFVGDYYVKFEFEHKKEVFDLVKKGVSEVDAVKKSSLMKEAKSLLRKWERGDKEIIKLWKKMNGWVYDGFNSTYRSINVSFDKNYYESETYLLGKKNIEEGILKKIFYKEEDSSVWIDLSKENFDKKLLLRSDGTSVYMTQDIGTAIKRFEDFPKSEKQIYTVGNEQDYHFKVLFKILDKLGYSWAKECYHLSYGMIDLPDGKMKSREGKVVDADELISVMKDTAQKRSIELGKIDDFDGEDLTKLYQKIALSALKYHLLKVDPKKKMLFNPDESIDFQGNTGPFLLYTYARIRSIIKRAEILNIEYGKINFSIIKHISVNEKKIIDLLVNYKYILETAAESYSPSIICNYVYDLSKSYNSFYQEEKIFDGKNNETTSFKIALSDITSKVIKSLLNLLGIDITNKM